MLDTTDKFIKDYYMFNGDINDLIGKPYADNGGDGVNSFDCASLVRYITGIESNIIPSCKFGDTRTVIKTIIKNKEHFKILDKPVDKCIVSLAQLRKPSHVGVYINGGVLHAIPKLGVIYSTFQNLKDNGYTWEFGVLNNG